jgi:2-methylcitrate dehydratase PrpD
MQKLVGASKDATDCLVEFASKLTYEALPSQAVATVKNLLLDGFGCSLAATALGDDCLAVTATMSAIGGAPESSIVGASNRVSAANAAFVNGAMVHALNYDAFSDETGHVGLVAFPAQLALAEAQGGVSGKELIVSVAVACEIVARMNAAIVRQGLPPSDKYVSGQLLGYIGAGAGAARLLGLTDSAFKSALGLALMQAAGSRQIVVSGDFPAKSIYGAFPNHAAVIAALLARSGVRADCDVLSGKAGLYAMVYGNTFDAGTLTEGLGLDFLFTATEFKPWPASNRVHAAIDAALTIAVEISDSHTIRAVRIEVPPRLQEWCEPLARKLRPENSSAAANSIPYCVVRALLDRRIDLASFSMNALTDARLAQLGRHTSVTICEGREGVLVSVMLSDGSEHERTVTNTLGSRARPITAEHLRAKFRSCCENALTPLSFEEMDRIESTLMDIEVVPDVRIIGDMLRPRSN